ncbi:MAG: Re/Si-specific NAD(P)(+) transhydrogenase subunit alpha [Phycisphaerales bacterium]|nr:MAG: Re/Si-specific NAD(P)(+) transhydrogenase subunit alpha [Phycisphaerales bacterium]
MRLGVVSERRAGETRVALVPESVKKLKALGHEVVIEAGAGEGAAFADAQFAEIGASVESSRAGVLGACDLLAGVNAPDEGDIRSLRKGAMVLASLFPTRNLSLVGAMAEAGVTAFSTDAIPRTTKAQAMDTLSSMANIAGYRGVLLAATHLGKYFPMFMTAAGTVLAAKVFVIGAGVAGLQAIATARRLGAAVSATDVRPEVKEQIESVGAKYVGIELKESAQAGGGYARELSDEDKARQRELLAEQCAMSDVVVTTALIGGVTAPRLISKAIVERMRPGSVIVDLAADGGGNCEVSHPGETVRHHGVSILAPTNVAAGMPTHASLLWSRNLTSFISTFTREGVIALDGWDAASAEILAGAMITHQGQVVHARTKEALRHGA